MRKSLFLVLVLLALLVFAPLQVQAIQYCQDEAISVTSEVQNKSTLIFDEGGYWPSYEQHGQLWQLENGKFQVLSGQLNERWRFQPTRFYTWSGYMWIYKHRTVK